MRPSSPLGDSMTGKNQTFHAHVSPVMERRSRSRLKGLLLVSAAVLAVACTPGGPGATTAPGNASAAPGGGSVAPPSLAPSPGGKGGYGY
jgi:hypothetical protein